MKRTELFALILGVSGLSFLVAGWFFVGDNLPLGTALFIVAGGDIGLSVYFYLQSKRAETE